MVYERRMLILESNSEHPGRILSIQNITLLIRTMQEEEVCWEQWTLDVTLATPRTESGKNIRMLYYMITAG